MKLCGGGCWVSELWAALAAPDACLNNTPGDTSAGRNTVLGTVTTANDHCQRPMPTKTRSDVEAHSLKGEPDVKTEKHPEKAWV